MPAPANGDYTMTNEQSNNPPSYDVEISNGTFTLYDDEGDQVDSGTVVGRGNTWTLDGQNNEFVIQQEDGTWNWQKLGGDTAGGRMMRSRGGSTGTGNQQN
jgi:hypothetical protein